MPGEHGQKVMPMSFHAVLPLGSLRFLRHRPEGAAIPMMMRRSLFRIAKAMGFDITIDVAESPREVPPPPSEQERKLEVMGTSSICQTQQLPGSRFSEQAIPALLPNCSLSGSHQWSISQRYETPSMARSSRIWASGDLLPRLAGLRATDIFRPLSLPVESDSPRAARFGLVPVGALTSAGEAPLAHLMTTI